MTCSKGCCSDQRTHYRSLTVVGALTRDAVKEGRDEGGHRFKAVTDELNNTVTQRHGDRQDVIVRPNPIDLAQALGG
jgi:hypothetical protein